MWPYWFLFLLPAFLALNSLRPVSLPAETTTTLSWNRRSDLWRVMYLLLVLIIGLRHQVGGDWPRYLDHVNALKNASIGDALQQKEPAVGLLNLLAANSGMGVYFSNTVCAVIFAWGLTAFCQAQPRPWLALVVAIPYLVTVVAMGYTSQGVAIGLAMRALVALNRGSVVRFVFLVGLAATFHKIGRAHV